MSARYLAGTPDITVPTITSTDTVSVAENVKLAKPLTATEFVVWTVTGGADQAKFEISGSTLRWAGDGTKDYEAPNDSDTNNTYVVQVTATDTSGNSANQTITATVTDAVDTAPTITSSASVSASDDAQLAHSLTSNQTVTWSIVGGVDAAQFEISGSTLRWSSNGTRDFSSPQDSDANNTYLVTVRATNSASLTTDQSITTTVAGAPSLGPELWPQPDFDASTGLTLLGGGGSITAGEWRSRSGLGSAVMMTTPPTVTVGQTYQYEYTVSANPGGDDAYVRIGETTVMHSGTGLKTGTLTVTSTSAGEGSSFSFGNIDGSGVLRITSASIKLLS